MDSSKLSLCPTCGGTSVEENGVFSSITDDVSLERIRILSERLDDERINLAAQKAYVKQLKDELRRRPQREAAND